MKFTVFSLALASYAMGDLSLLAPTSNSAGVQCQGDCQGEESVAPQLDGSAVPGAIHAFMREFMGTDVPAPLASPSTEYNRDFNQPTPVIELIYNYINPNTASEEETPIAQQTLASAEQEEGPINRLVAAFINPSTDYLPGSAIEDAQDNKQYPAQVQSQGSKILEFDFNSWGDRVSSAANRLVKNVEGIVVQFMPTPSSSVAWANSEKAESAILADVDEETAATNFIEVEAESSNPAHWYDFI
ncbi:hypothetical protein IWW36_001845 [Coemansia brasiliensis]|uniref:Uncharacterized protein n=1 Tax=Coemansia brasiliensis TaxID=2650707 RepID=A0A9W8M0H7_9FUNG|nr:hypothetical protein IWW36_001845 [Coemansia brasiliensis]